MIKAKEYLQQVKKLDAMIRNDVAEKARWESVALGMGSPKLGERVQSTSNPHKMADAIVEAVELGKRINERIIERQTKRQEILGIIEQLNEAEYDLLYKVYFQYLTLDEVAFAKERSKSWSTSVHGLALKHVQDILDKSEMH